MQISPIAASAMDVAPSNAIAPSKTTAQDFSSMVADHLGQVDSHLKAADTQAIALAAGRDVPVHDVMIAMERARVDLMLVVEVRNRVIEAYQELTRMQL